MTEQTTEDDIRLYDLYEVAARLSVSYPHAYELCRGGQIESRRIGNRIRVQPDALRRYIASLPAEPEGD